MAHTRLHVGDLAHSTTEQDLLDLFANAGEVLSVDFNQSFVFVQMGSPEAARLAVARYNDYDLKGSRLVVYAVPQRSRPKP